MLNTGPDYQTDGTAYRSGTGFGGLNLGVGEFLKEDLALFVRLPSTQANLDRGINRKRIAGFFGTSLQYWFNNNIYIEGGLGVGFSKDKFEQRFGLSGISVLAGYGVTLFNRGGNNVQLGLEYTPASLTGENPS